MQLFATSWTIALQAPLSMGFPRHENWNYLPFPSWRNLPNPGIKPRSPALTGRFFITWPTKKVQELFRVRIIDSTNKINTSKVTNTTNLFFPVLDIAFQRGSSVWPAHSILVNKLHAKSTTHDLIWWREKLGKKESDRKFGKKKKKIYIYIYFVSNETQSYNARHWKLYVCISVMGLYLAGKPDDGISLASHSFC